MRFISLKNTILHRPFWAYRPFWATFGLFSIFNHQMQILVIMLVMCESCKGF